METRSGRRVRYTASSTTLSSDDDSDQDAQHNLHGFTFSTIPAIEPSSESDDDTHGRARGPSQSVSGSSKRTRVTSPSKSSLAAASRRTKLSRTTHNDDSGSELSSASKLRAEERAVGTHMLSPIERALGHVFVSEAESTESAEPAKPLPAANGQPETVAVLAKAEQEEPGRVSAPRPVSKAQTRTLFGASNNKTPFVASGNKESGVVPVENEDMQYQDDVLGMVGPSLTDNEWKVTKRMYRSELDFQSNVRNMWWYQLATLISGEASAPLDQFIDLEHVLTLPSRMLAQRAEGVYPDTWYNPYVGARPSVVVNNVTPNTVEQQAPPAQAEGFERRPSPRPEAVGATQFGGNGEGATTTSRVSGRLGRQMRRPYPFGNREYQKEGAAAVRDALEYLNRSAANGIVFEKPRLTAAKQLAYQRIVMRFPHLAAATIEDFGRSTDLSPAFASLAANADLESRSLAGKLNNFEVSYKRIGARGTAALQRFRFAKYTPYVQANKRISLDSDKVDDNYEQRKQRWPHLYGERREYTSTPALFSRIPMNGTLYRSMGAYRGYALLGNTTYLPR